MLSSPEQQRFQIFRDMSLSIKGANGMPLFPNAIKNQLFAWQIICSPAESALSGYPLSFRRLSLVQALDSFSAATVFALSMDDL